MPTPPANAWAASAPANTGVDTGLDTARPVLDFGAHIPFVQMLGLVLHRMQDGQSELSYALQPQHTNSFGITHGGVSMTLLDVTMACAARSLAPELGVVTIEMKTSFMQPARGQLLACGRLLHRTRSMAFTEATIYDAQGQVCSHATGTFRYVPRTQSDSGPATD
ncbi:hypothetical protein MASR1M59_28820 [Melaminivora sp.]